MQNTSYTSLAQNTARDFASTFCKAARSAGLSAHQEHYLEDELYKQVLSSGPEFVVKRWKSLQQEVMSQLDDPDHVFHVDDMAHNASGPLSPPMRWVYTRRKTKTKLNIIGAVMSAYKHDSVSYDQAKDWINNIEPSQSRSTADDNLIHELSLSIDHYVNWRAVGARTLKSMNSNPTPTLRDMTGASFPLPDGETKVSPLADDRTRKLARAYVMQWDTIPRIAVEFAEQQSHILSGESVKKHDLPDYKAHDGLSNKPYYMYNPVESFNLDDEDDVVGQIGFLEQEKGKLRTVANPNRILQGYLRHYGEALQDEVDSNVESSVRDQAAGRKWVKSSLALGHSLASVDMTAASDRLDFSTMAQAMRESINRQMPEDSKEKQSLLISQDLFEKASRANWRVPDRLVRSHMRILRPYDEDEDLSDQTSLVRWKEGQPLGLRPSFPTLTLMNMAMAGIATGNKHNSFRVVGDDAILPSDCFEKYIDIVNTLGGEVNTSKSIVSDHTAEFVGYLITSKHEWLKTPKFHNPNDKNALDIAKQFGASNLMLPDSQIHLLAKGTEIYTDKSIPKAYIDAIIASSKVEDSTLRELPPINMGQTIYMATVTSDDGSQRLQQIPEDKLQLVMPSFRDVDEESTVPVLQRYEKETGKMVSASAVGNAFRLAKRNARIMAQVKTEPVVETKLRQTSRVTQTPVSVVVGGEPSNPVTFLKVQIPDNVKEEKLSDAVNKNPRYYIDVIDSPVSSLDDVEEAALQRRNRLDKEFVIRRAEEHTRELLSDKLNIPRDAAFRLTHPLDKDEMSPSERQKFTYAHMMSTASGLDDQRNLQNWESYIRSAQKAGHMTPDYLRKEDPRFNSRMSATRQPREAPSHREPVVKHHKAKDNGLSR